MATNTVFKYSEACFYNPYISKWQSQEGWQEVEKWRAENPAWEKNIVRY
jgi:trimethylamine:corrinoid methyltransferase-like protein